MKLYEMRFLWILICIGAAVTILHFLNVPTFWDVVGKTIFLITGGVIVFLVSLRLAKANAQLTIASERLGDIIANLEDGVIVYDENFLVSMVNNATEQIFGFKKEDLLKKRIGPEMVKEPKMKILAQTVFPSLAPQSIQRSETGVYPQITDIVFEAPERWIRTYTVPLRDNNGNISHFMKTIEDRTREVQLQRSKSQFIAVAAHQLRTPLTAIQWIFELLINSPTIAPDDKGMAGDGIQASTKLLKIVNDLLDVSKIEEGRFGYTFKTINIVEFIEDILKKAVPIARQYGVNVYFDKGEMTNISVSIDPDKLGMAMSNFIDNAIKYNIKNGTVTVAVKQKENDQYIEISIKDTGIGIPSEDMKQLFNKFFRAENAATTHTDGSGLGLYIAKNIIERHGGAVWAESVLKRGTTFFFTLPTDISLIPPKEAGVIET
ncbi:MAG: ATP-binding protein [bacterium]